MIRRLSLVRSCMLVLELEPTKAGFHKVFRPEVWGTTLVLFFRLRPARKCCSPLRLVSGLLEAVASSGRRATCGPGFGRLRFGLAHSIAACAPLSFA